MEVTEIKIEVTNTEPEQPVDSSNVPKSNQHRPNRQPALSDSNLPAVQWEHFPEKKGGSLSKFFGKKVKVNNTTLDPAIPAKYSKFFENKAHSFDVKSNQEKSKMVAHLIKSPSSEIVPLQTDAFRDTSSNLGDLLDRRPTREDLIIRNILRGDNEVVMSWGPFMVQRITKQLKPPSVFDFEKEFKLSPLLKEVDHFKVDSGFAFTTVLQVIVENAEKDTQYYKENFATKEHSNWIGTQKDGSPTIVSIRKDMEKDIPPKDKDFAFRAVIRTPTGTQFGFFYAQSSSKAIKSMKMVKPAKYGETVWKQVSNEIVNDLIQMEEQLISFNYKFGVLYRKDGQFNEDEMFSNNLEETSPEFLEFLNFLGEKIELKGWKNFRGGLDVKTESTGTHSLYTKFYDYEIMYHVAPFLPFSQQDKQQLERKRHLGNDVVVIIFQESTNTPFDPTTLTSEFNHVFVVIAPLKIVDVTHYRVSISTKDGVPAFGPDFPANALFPKGETFRDFLLTKLLNAERAALYASVFAKKFSRTNYNLLQNILDKYSK